jgi:DNA-binding CsgD family transcriptional regulator
METTLLEVQAKPALDPASALDPANEVISGLVEQLIQEVLAAKYLFNAKVVASNGKKLLLDVEMDGIRCMVFSKPREPSPEQTSALSPRELEIVRMVAKGLPNKVIADVLEISSWTVCTHLRRIFAKVGVHSRAAMVAKLMNDRGTADLLGYTPEIARE